MKVAAWLVQNPNRPLGAVYGGVLWTDPTSGATIYCTAYGAHATIKNNTMQVTLESDPQRVPAGGYVTAFDARLTDRRSSGYTVDLAEPCVFDYQGLATESYENITKQVLRAVSGGLGAKYPGALDAAAEATGAASAPAPVRRPAPRRSAVKKPKLAPSALAPIPLPDGGEYFPRMVGGVTDVDLLRKARTALRQSCGLYGGTGSGKTTLPVAAFGDELVVIEGHEELTVADLVGQFVPAPDGVTSASGFVFVPGPLLTAVEEGRPVLINELTRIPGTTLAKLFSVMDFQRTLTVEALGGKVVKAADGFWVCATWNDQGEGLHELDEALLRRFPIRLLVENDYTAAERRGVEARLVKIGRTLDTMRRQQIADGDIPVWAPSVATLLDMQKMLDAGLGDEFVANALLTACPDNRRDDDVINKIATCMGIKPTPLALTAVA
ncbi:AAA family ATPase [Gordonia sihwensis]|uniref:AAA family ATPase n=1 Tax=Gordonia sihwensis TaxID=173559 RepID=UPI0005F005E6|nr:AAA family ATPase [Gordonia sihwensis]KJR10520.1 hypothetical protein UG54_00550 [Gordonia sihwensis]